MRWVASHVYNHILFDLWFGDTGDRWTAARIIHAHGGRTGGKKILNDEQMGGADDEESLYVTHNIMISVRPIENCVVWRWWTRIFPLNRRSEAELFLFDPISSAWQNERKKRNLTARQKKIPRLNGVSRQVYCTPRDAVVLFFFSAVRVDGGRDERDSLD